ncbi:MAG TPA: hypothetical protein VHB25_12965 [Gemmatimonadaceae bacterium]|nr:hypothetical protein [Gemmatimonadaceae bacterium]
MSESRARRALLAGIALGLCASARGAAQSVDVYRHQLDSIGREWRVALAAKAESDSAAVRTIPGDTIRVGALLALSDSTHRSLARGTLARLAPQVDSAYGASVRALARHPFVIHTSERDTSLVITGMADSAGVVQLMSSDYPNEQALANSWRNKLDALMSGLAPPDFQKWLLATIPTGEPTEANWTNDRIQLVLADSRVAHDCAAGDVRACLEAFQLVPIANPAFELYDAAQQREIIDRHGYLLRQSDPAAYDDCMMRSVRAACVKILSGMPAEAIPQPIPASLRQSLVQYALWVGGSGAFDRLVNTPGAPREQLEAAAKMPAESLVAQWRTASVATRSGSRAIDLGTALASIAWAALFAGLSLRSSRWR